MQMRIGGRVVDGADERWMPVINPATGEEIERVPEGTAVEVDQAVQAAEGAFDEWGARTPRERGMFLAHAAVLVRDQHQDLARTLTMEQGKPLRESLDEVRGFANILEFYAGLSASMQGEFVTLGPAGDLLVTHRPLGVCGAIIPWNMPALIMGWKLGPSLLCGNTMVFKPAAQAPLTALRLAGLMESAGLPAGVLNMVTGRGEIVGEAIVRHPNVKKVSFTGDSGTGRRIRELAAATGKEVILELGGSDPMIVWKDADLDKAVQGALRGRFYNCGQTCTAVKRLFVHHAIGKKFVSRLKSRVKTLTVGNGLLPGVEMGPMSGSPQRDRIAGLVDAVRDRSQGEILIGGASLTGKGYDDGFFYSPTLVSDPVPESPLLSQEVFGPVLPIMCVPDLETAINHANETIYGLGASIWTKDIAVIKEVFTRVQAGVVWANRHLTVPPEMPFGGVKGSGTGRENGIQALRAYTREKILFLGW
jgi:succinate-semialdehyde dehydrogenase/glutarate-semialdehyde dehydrogenase